MLGSHITPFSINPDGKKYESNIYNRNSNSCNRPNNRLSSSLHIFRFKFTSTHSNSNTNTYSIANYSTNSSTHSYPNSKTNHSRHSFTNTRPNDKPITNTSTCISDGCRSNIPLPAA